MASPTGFKTSLELFRDCLRLVRYIAPGGSPKGVALRSTIKKEFRKNAGLTDPEQIHACKAQAIRGLSNYLLATNAQKDPKVQAAMDSFKDRSTPTPTRKT